MDELIDVIIGKTVLLYGEAGSGKTNLSLWLLSNIVRRRGGRGVFISTDGPKFIHLLSRYSVPDNTLFLTALTTEHIISSLIQALRDPRNISVVVIDPVNGLYRYEVLMSREATRTFSNLLALAAKLKEVSNSTLILTAQVRFDERLSFSGEEFLRFWSDVIIRLSKADLHLWEAEIEEPSELKNTRLYFRISGRGIEFA